MCTIPFSPIVRVGKQCVRPFPKSVRLLVYKRPFVSTSKTQIVSYGIMQPAGDFSCDRQTFRTCGHWTGFPPFTTKWFNVPTIANIIRTSFHLIMVVQMLITCLGRFQYLIFLVRTCSVDLDRLPTCFGANLIKVSVFPSRKSKVNTTFNFFGGKALFVRETLRLNRRGRKQPRAFLLTFF